jgi:hypothetical protein
MMAGGKDIYAERAWCPPSSCNSVRRVDATLADRLARFPEGYRYLAYLQVRVGYPVKPDMPGLRGPAAEGLERLYQRGAAWLAGEIRVPLSP